MKNFILLINIFACCSFNVFSQYKAAYMPDNEMINLRFDGRSDDWDWFPEDFIIKRSKISGPADIQEDNFDVQIRIAWNSIKNWIFFYVEIEDDTLIVNKDKPNAGDYFKIYIDPDNNRKEIVNNTTVTRCNLYYLLENSIKFVDKKSEWMNDPKYCKYKCVFEKKELKILSDMNLV